MRLNWSWAMYYVIPQRIHVEEALMHSGLEYLGSVLYEHDSLDPYEMVDLPTDRKPIPWDRVALAEWVLDVYGATHAWRTRAHMGWPLVFNHFDNEEAIVYMPVDSTAMGDRLRAECD